MSMQIDWIRCNHCNAKITNAENPFSLTQCGHIYCSGCIVSAQTQCPQCKAVSVLTMAMTKPLQPCFMPYFSPVENSLNDLCKSLSFQNNQRNIIMARLEELEEKYSQIKKEFWSKMQQFQMLKNKLEITQAEIEEKKMRLKTLKKLPISNSSSTKNADYRSRSNISLLFHDKKVLSVQSDRPSAQIQLTPKRQMNEYAGEDFTFRIPTCTKVPRSARQRKTPFSNYTASSSSSSSSSNSSSIFSNAKK